MNILSVNDVIRSGSALLSRNRPPAVAEQESRIVLEYVTGKSWAQLLANPLISEQEQENFIAYINEMVQHHKPLAYVLGTVSFLGLELVVRPPCLIPRPETEFWCQWLIDYCDQAKQKPTVILDVCTGSGCIALALASHFSQASVTAIDCDVHACALARENVQKCGFYDRVCVMQGDLFGPVNHIFDIITANPPYISQSEYDDLDRSVKDWEAYHALCDGEDGMQMVKRIIKEGHSYLAKKGIMMIEIHECHADELMVYAKNICLYDHIQIVYDQYRKPRSLMLAC